MGGRLDDSLTRLSADAVGDVKRVVAIKFFLDRPGMDVDKSSVRVFKGPPVICKASDVASFLERQGLLKPGVLAEVYLDRFKAFMSVDACDKSGVEFDLSESTGANPATIAVRLSTATAGAAPEAKPAAAKCRQCNMSPCGLFAFSLLMGLEATMISHELMPKTRVKSSYILTWSCYAFFIGGLLQLLVGILEVFRNNVYGATAFMSFGSFWLANGLQMLIKTYFPEEISESLLEQKDEWGRGIREFYLAAFVFGLWIQTLSINKMTTLLVTLLDCKLIFAAFAESRTWCMWAEMVFTWIVSVLAYCLFVAEFTNEVYGREVFNLLPWHAGEEPQSFAAAGKNGAMVMPTGIELRAAPFQKMSTRRK